MSEENRSEKNEIDLGDEGNTGSSSPAKNAPKQGAQYLYWAFTYHQIERIEVFLSILKHEVDWYVINEEIGKETNKLHANGQLKLKKPRRMTELKKLDKTVRWEATKSCTASVVYCTKMETATGKTWVHGIDVPEELDIEPPYGWQNQVLDIVKEKPDRRTIHWFWEPNGNVGKTSLCKYLCVKHNALMLSGKSSDMFHMLAEYPNKRKLIVVDVPRSSQEYINYGAIEQIKNGLVFSGKYKGAQLVFNNPHVIVFSNQKPDTSMLSKDRWNIVRIRTGEDTEFDSDLE